MLKRMAVWASVIACLNYLYMFSLLLVGYSANGLITINEPLVLAQSDIMIQLGFGFKLFGAFLAVTLLVLKQYKEFTELIPKSYWNIVTHALVIWLNWNAGYYMIAETLTGIYFVLLCIRYNYGPVKDFKE